MNICIRRSKVTEAVEYVNQVPSVEVFEWMCIIQAILLCTTYVLGSVQVFLLRIDWYILYRMLVAFD